MLGLTESLSKKRKQLVVNPLKPVVSRAVTIYGKSRDYIYMESHVTIHIWKSAVSGVVSGVVSEAVRPLLDRS